MIKAISGVLGAAVFLLIASFGALAQQANPMTFFVTSVGSGNGANFGGLTGADKHCQTLGAAAGAGNRTWRAYLSAAAAAGQPAVNAKDRIGTGPWTNVKGVVIAKSVADLHSDENNIKKDTALTEKGTVVNGVGDTPNQHDILTGSQADGTLQPATPPATDATCSNWTSGADEGAAQLGHVDRMGRGAAGPSWNSAHISRGCSVPNLARSGGAGYLYCFAAN